MILKKFSLKIPNIYSSFPEMKDWLSMEGLAFENK